MVLAPTLPRVFRISQTGWMTRLFHKPYNLSQLRKVQSRSTLTSYGKIAEGSSNPQKALKLSYGNLTGKLGTSVQYEKSNFRPAGQGSMYQIFPMLVELNTYLFKFYTYRQWPDQLDGQIVYILCQHLSHSALSKHRALRHKLKSCTVPILYRSDLVKSRRMLYRPNMCNCTMPYVPRTVPAYAVRDPAYTAEVFALTLVQIYVICPSGLEFLAGWVLSLLCSYCYQLNPIIK